MRTCPRPCSDGPQHQPPSCTLQGRRRGGLQRRRAPLGRAVPSPLVCGGRAIVSPWGPVSAAAPASGWPRAGAPRRAPQQRRGQRRSGRRYHSPCRDPLLLLRLCGRSASQGALSTVLWSRPTAAWGGRQHRWEKSRGADTHRQLPSALWSLRTLFAKGKPFPLQLSCAKCPFLLPEP